MKRYLVTRYYRSHIGEFQKGKVLELEDDLAAWMNRDSKGVLELIPPNPPAEIVAAPAPERAIEQPPKDRMVRGAKKRRK
jgi:hypothetical protein